MRIISRRMFREYWEIHPDSYKSLFSWYCDVRAENWNSPADIKKKFGTASFLPNNRVVFNIKGNHYRLVVVVVYEVGKVFIRFVGTHAEYDRIDGSKV